MIGLGIAELAIMLGICVFLGVGIGGLGFVLYAASKNAKKKNDN